MAVAERVRPERAADRGRAAARGPRPGSAPPGRPAERALGNQAIQRLARSAPALPQGFDALHALALARGGRPLPAPLRGALEAELARDLGGVRLHDGTAAERAAGTIAADAYTVGRDVVFGRGRLAPETPAGERLLRHEVAHVARQGGGSHVPRALVPDEDPAPAAGSVQRQATATADEPLASFEPAPFTPAASFDPHAVDVHALTNEQLLAEIVRAGERLGRQVPDDPERSAYSILRDRLATERGRRIGLGHVWLQAATRRTPTALIGVVPAGDGTHTVTRPEPAQAAGPPVDLRGARILTQAQFEALLVAQGIPTIDAATYQRIALRLQAQTGPGGAGGVADLPEEAALAGVAAGRPYLPGFGAMTEGAFAYRLNAGWAGRFAEASYGLGQRPFTAADLNLRAWVDSAGNVQRGNYPVFDWAPGLFGEQFTSVKISTLADRGARLNYFLRGHAELLGTQPGATNLSAFLANQPGLTQADVARIGQLAINPEDLSAYRDLLRDPRGRLSQQATLVNWERAGVQRVYDGYLRASPATVGSATYGDFQSLHDAFRSGAITETQFFDTLSRVGARAADAATSHGLPTGRAGELRAGRAGLGTPEAVRGFGAGEFVSEGYYGGGARGAVLAGGEAGARGGVYGGLIAVVIEGTIFLIDEREHPNWEAELGQSLGRGAIGGGAGGVTEQLLAARLLPAAAGTGSTALRAAGARAGLGGAGAGVGAIVLETIDIAREQREHTADEVALREGRAFVIGGASGVVGTAVGGAAGTILTAALTGTAAGTAVPGLGNAIGFVIGLGVGIAVAYGLSQAIPEVPPNISLGSPGSGGTPEPRPERLIPPGCFAAGTRIRLADGRSVPIAEVAVGDEVVTVDERAGRRCVERVLAVRRHGPRPLVDIRMAGAERPLRATREHALHTGTMWAPAGSIGAGATLARLPGGGPRLERAVVASVADAEPEPVISLTVSGCHTYVAEDVLVHNLKIF
jgi:hypothetical protein